MSDNHVQTVSRSNFSDTTTSAVTVTGVVAGNTLVAFFFDGLSATLPGTFTVSSSNGGSFGAAKATAADATNQVFGGVFVLQNANAGSHTITGTTTASHSTWIAVVEVGTSGAATAYADAKAAFQSNPGAGANVLSSGSLTIAAAATLVAFSVDTGSTTGSDEPTAGTSPIAFTSRDNNASSTMGAYRLSTGAASANAAATAGPVTTAHPFITLGAAILNAAGAAVAVSVQRLVMV